MLAGSRGRFSCSLNPFKEEDFTVPLGHLSDGALIDLLEAEKQFLAHHDPASLGISRPAPFPASRVGSCPHTLADLPSRHAWPRCNGLASFS